MSAQEHPDIDPMVQFYESIFSRVIERVLDTRNATFPAVDEETAGRIAKINAKPRITVQEAALYLNCSESHLYAKIKAAKKGASAHPIPFLDLDGVYVLPREQLLLWAQTDKSGLKSVNKRAKNSAISDRS
jgi:hypothetical protein